MMQSQMVTSKNPFLNGLNDPQREAVETTEGPLLVLAGAGTGKTRVLTTRLSYILSQKLAWPNQILAVTFTNKAAGEMKDRVASLMGRPLEGWWLGTFHALGARMLRRHADMVGLSPTFTILDQDDQIRLIKQLALAENVDIKKWPPKMMAATISNWKDKALTPKDLGQDDIGDIAHGKMLKLYEQYQARLKILNACDFGDLLLHPITIFKSKNGGPILQSYHTQFKYILVDEYQDTNTAQYQWLRLLAQGSKNICCVGDDDQSIYGWRGAQVENILRFERDFQGAKIIRLEQNYRSTQTILKAASEVIRQNQSRHSKTLWSEGDQGEPIRIQGLWDGEAEARFVGDEIESLQGKGHNLNEIAILVRAGYQMREFEERFIQLGMPYRVIGGPRFYERMEIRDALAYLRVTAQPDDDLALERIINTPKRGIGNTTVQKLHTHARTRGISLFESIRELLQSDEFRPKLRATLTELVRNFDRWAEQSRTMKHEELAGVILDESGYTAMWQADKTPEAEGRLENLKELLGAMAEFENLPAFLEHVSLVLETAQDNGQPQVTLMTLHGAKGLEFETVFLPGWEEGLFPSQRSMDENGNAGLEEERRLAYVGITRAKQRAIISYVANRRVHGQWNHSFQSRFIEELPEDCTDHQSDMQSPQTVFSRDPNKDWGRSQHWDSSGSFGGHARKALPTHLTQAIGAGSDFTVGDRVRHKSFGDGRVIFIEGAKLDILFDTAGQKRVLSSFIEKI